MAGVALRADMRRIMGLGACRYVPILWFVLAILKFFFGTVEWGLGE